MDSRISRLDWDVGNRAKCQRHGLAMADVEHVLLRARHVLLHDKRNSIVEDRYIAIGQTVAERYAFVVFTVRFTASGMALRPISARYMHKKEIAKYEKEIARL